MKMICELRTPFGQVGGEGQPLLGAVAAHQLLEPGLVDRDPAALQRADLGRVLVDADDVVPVFGEAGARHQPDVPRSDDRDFHECVLRTAE